MATKKFDRTVWHGTDCDKVTSLFEYGLLVRVIIYQFTPPYQ